LIAWHCSVIANLQLIAITPLWCSHCFLHDAIELDDVTLNNVLETIKAVVLTILHKSVYKQRLYNVSCSYTHTQHGSYASAASSAKKKCAALAFNWTLNAVNS
jgi:hypothetical protein